MTPKDLAALAKVCQRHGITKLKMADVEFTIEPQVVSLPQALDNNTKTEEQKDLTEEELLFWSSGQTA